MDFDDSLAEFDKNITFEEEKDEMGFGLNEHELRELENTSDAVIFAIDCRASMLDKNKYNESKLSNFDTVIKAAVGFLKTKIISSEMDQTGVVLYNCDKTQNTLNFDGVYILEKLDRPNAESIKFLETLIDSKEQRFHAAENEVPLSELLWTCQQQFKSLEMNTFSKRIFLFTNEENPMADTPKAKEDTIERAKNLTDEDTEIELFPMCHPELDKPQFDVTIFYSNILTVGEDELDELKDFETAYLRVQDLSKRIRLKEFKKRVLGKCMFSLTPKMKVGLKFFNLVKSTKKPSAKFINKNNNKELKSLTKYVCKETGEVLYRNQMATHFPVKNKKVSITEADMKKIKHLEEPGMRLIGFKSKDSIKTYHNIRPSYFIYPDEKVMRGSSQAFHAMIKSLLKKNKVAMARFVPRERAMVRFCALVPQDESQSNDLYGGQYTPPGLNVIFLPYAEDVRDIEDHLAYKERIPQPNKEENRAAKLFVKNMSVDFNSRNFENPNIQRFYSGLQAFALNEEPEEIQDTLEPDYEGMEKMQPVVDQVKKVFGLGSIPKPLPKKPRANKRKREEEDKNSGAPSVGDIKENDDSDSQPSRGKRGKKAVTTKEEAEEVPMNKIKQDEKISDAKLKQMSDEGELIQLTAKRLKELCLDRDVEVKANTKRILIAKLQEYIESNMQ